MRKCSKPGCPHGAVATLTYDYYDSTAVLGPLSGSAQPHAYDLCENHAESMTVPRGWQVMRLQTRFEPAPPSGDDLLALVEVIRDVAGEPSAQPNGMPDMTETGPPQVNSQGDPRSGRHAGKQATRFTVVRGDLDN